MAKLSLVKGTTSYRAYLFIQDSSVSTGAGKTGLVFDTASLVGYYVRPGASPTAITLVTQTVTGAYSSGGFVEIDSANMPGLYRLDVPDAVLATGVNAAVVLLKGAANMSPVVMEIEITGVDNQNASTFGLTNLDAAITTRLAPTVAGRTLDVSAAGEAGLDWANIGSPTTAQNLSATNIDADQVVASVSGAVGSVTGNVGGNVVGSVASVTAGVTVTTNNDKTGYGLSSAAVQAIWDALTSALTTVGSIGKLLVDNITGNAFTRLGAPVGASISADVAAVQSDTNDIQTRLPAALVSGRIDASVGAMAANTLTAAALATDAVTEIQSGLSTVDAAGIRTAVGLASANLDTQLDTIDNFLDTEIAAILAAVDTEVAAIKAKTDLIPAAPAAVGDVPTANANADALLDRTAGVETSRTVRQALRLMLAALGGKLSGAATTTVTIRDTNDGVNRIVATVDADGNRSAVVYDAS